MNKFRLRSMFHTAFALMALAAISFSFTACGDDDDDNDGTVHVTSVTLPESYITLNVGETYQITPTVLPANAAMKDVTYTADNDRFLTVSSTGLITAKAKGGTTVITVKTKDREKTATLRVDVTDYGIVVDGTKYAFEWVTVEYWLEKDGYDVSFMTKKDGFDISALSFRIPAKYVNGRYPLTSDLSTDKWYCGVDFPGELPSYWTDEHDFESGNIACYIDKDNVEVELAGRTYPMTVSGGASYKAFDFNVEYKGKYTYKEVK